MAKKPKREVSKPSSQQMESLRQLVSMVETMQETMKQQSPELYTKLMEMQKRK
tara:strand:- start:664 stop:822 length:159 start_codon:yes stop_codon:yes gene_type:complete